MGKKTFLFVFFIITAIAFPLNALSQDTSNEIKASPTAVIYSSNNETIETPDTISEGGSYTGSAPIEMGFYSMVESDKTNLRYEWVIATDQDCENVILTRYDEDMEYTFTDAGTSYIQLRMSDTETGAEYTSMPFAVTVSESSLELPNAFSPNGDGINDIYKVKYQSIVKFKAYIFNRWGQRLYSWSINDIDNGWDGTYRGKKVKDGVYFIYVEAEGSDRVKYKKKSDINILTGTNNNTNGSISE